MTIALDATYSVGTHLSGVGVYSREMLWGLARAYAGPRWLFYYRPHRLLRSLGMYPPPGARRRLLLEAWAPSGDLFHGLNQRLPQAIPKRTVTTFHDLFVLSGDYSTPEFRRRFEGQARDAAARSELIIAVSRFTASQVESLLGVDAKRIRVVPHGVRGPSPQMLATRRPEKMILSVGAIQKRKNTARLIDAFRAAPAGWKLVLAGSHGYGAEEALERARRSPRSADILIPGYVPDSALASLYARAAIFAFPSLDEGFGMPVLDAMAWGIPVITANRSGLAEIAGDAAIRVDPFRVDSIAQAIETLCGAEGFRRMLGEKGRQHAAGFPWDRAVEQTWAAYQELL